MNMSLFMWKGVVYHLLQLIHLLHPIALCGFVYAIVLQYAFHLHKGTTAQEYLIGYGAEAIALLVIVVAQQPFIIATLAVIGLVRCAAFAILFQVGIYLPCIDLN